MYDAATFGYSQRLELLKNDDRILTLTMPDWNCAIENGAYDDPCSCVYTGAGEVDEWCDVCMFGARRAAYYRARDRCQQENIQDRDTAISHIMIIRELGYLIRLVTEEADEDEKLQLIRYMLRYLWDKQLFLSRNRNFLDMLRKKCEAWMDDPNAETIHDTVYTTLEILFDL